jgi:ATP:ADP antiporter, AAA family
MNFKTPGTNLRMMFSLNPRERNLAVSMFVYNFILLITLYLLKPVRDSLFLENVGAHELPFVFILAALVVIPVSLGYSRLSKRLSIGWLINIITVFLAANLLLIWAFIYLDLHSLYYTFYIWISIYSVLITSQFWLFANTIFNSIQAKKLFAFLSLGAIAGAFTGGELTGIFMDVFALQPETLLPICSIVLVATIPIVNWILILKRDPSGKIRSFKEKRETVAARSKNPISDVLHNKHLKLIMGLIAVSVVATTIIDFQFKSVVESAFESEAALTSYMGRFYGRVSLMAFLIQFFIGTYFTRKYGINGSIMLLPLALLLSSAAMLLIPGLFMATLTRGIDQTFKHSIDRTGRELLFMPLTNQLKKRVKVFIDLFVKHGAQGLAGLLLIGLTYGLGLGVQSLGFIVVSLIIIWVIIARKASKSYVGQLRYSIKKQINKTNGVNVKTDHETGNLNSLSGQLNRDHGVPSSEMSGILNHPDPDIPAEVLRFMNQPYNDESTDSNGDESTRKGSTQTDHQKNGRESSDAPNLTPNELTETIRQEVIRYSKLIKISSLFRQIESEQSKKVTSYIEFEIELSSRKIFGFLSQNYKHEDITNAYRAISGDDPNLRAEAIEFVENLFSWEIRKLIYPILDNYPNRDKLDNEVTVEFSNQDEIISFLGETLPPSLRAEITETIEDIVQNHSEIVS